METVALPAAVLRNKGVQLDLLKLSEDGTVAVNEEGEPETERFWLRFTSNVIADIEDAFEPTDTTELVDGVPVEVHVEGVDAWRVWLGKKKLRTIRKTLSIAFDLPEREVGDRMRPEDSMIYESAIGVAWMVANGVDAETAGKAHSAAVTMVRRGREKMTEEAAAAINAGVSLGTDGSESGSEQPKPEDSAGTSESSGS